MTVRILIASVSFLLMQFQASCQSRLEISAATAQQEADYIWQNLQDLSFFEENGYEVAFPNHQLIEQLKQKARAGNLKNTDYQKLRDIMSSEVYNSDDYEKGLTVVRRQEKVLNQMINVLENLELHWNFKFFNQYQIRLTLYGPGGSYDPEQGSILLFTTSSGGFKQYQNPTNTLIHEIVHLGIESSIINALRVPHSFKERVVDNFVRLNFGDQLPDYLIQNMGDDRADQLMKSREDLRSLDKKISELLHEGK